MENAISGRSDAPIKARPISSGRLVSSHRFQYKSDDSTASSSASREFVESQLTQSLGMDLDDEPDATRGIDHDYVMAESMPNDANDGNSSLNISPKHSKSAEIAVQSTSQSQPPAERLPFQSQPQTQSHTLSTNGNGSLISPSLQKTSFAIPIPPRPSRQAWYQPSLPRPRSMQSYSSSHSSQKLKASPSISTASNAATKQSPQNASQVQSQSQNGKIAKSRSGSRSLGNGYRSGSFLHTKNTSKNGSPVPIASQQHHESQPQPQSQSPFDSESSVYSNFNPYLLQTQAPYQSQSQSQ